MGTTSENPVRNHYFHAPEHVEEHKADLTDQAKNPQAPREGSGEKAFPMEGVIFDRSHYDLFTEALQDPNHPLRQAAEQAMRVFTVASEKTGKFKVPEVYQVVATLEEAAEKIGVPPEAIMTPKDITTEFHLTRSRINEWRRSGPHGQPHITPLPVRVSAGRGGQAQLLFLREAVERVVAHPPKPGPPRKS